MGSIECLAEPDNNSTTLNTLALPNLTSGDSVTIEIIHQFYNDTTDRVQEPVDAVYILMNGTRRIIEPAKKLTGYARTGGVIYRRTFANTNIIGDVTYDRIITGNPDYWDPITQTGDSKIRLESVKAYVFKKEIATTNQSILQIDQTGINNQVPFLVDLPPYQHRRNVKITVPLAGLQEDGRYVTISVREISEDGRLLEQPRTIFYEENSLQLKNGLDTLCFVFDDLEKNVTRLYFTVDTRNILNQGLQDVNGQSWMIGSIIIDEECRCIRPDIMGDDYVICSSDTLTRALIRENDTVMGDSIYAITWTNTILELYPDSIITGLTFRRNGRIDYIPLADSCYTLSFRYSVVVNGRDEEACRDFANVNIKVVKNEAPSLLNLPSDVNFTCIEKPPIPNVRAVNSCNEEIAVEMTETELSFSPDPCTYRFSRTWTATDACGNTASATQFIILIDSLAPILDAPPVDIMLECGEEVPPSPTLNATDNCSEIIVSMEEIREDSSCFYTLTRTWIAEDSCQNQTVVQQTILVQNDTISPVFSDTPQDMTVDCIEDAALNITVTDNCDDLIDIVFNEEITGTCTYQVIRTWTAVDACDNSTIMTQTITVNDEEAPVFSDTPQDMTVDCLEEDVPTITATDNCLGVVEVIFNEVKTGTCPSYQISRTWTAVDSCQNSATMTQNITVIDELAPVFSSTPQDMTVDCIEEGVPLMAAMDNCMGIVNIIFNEEKTGICPYQIIRTWTAVDSCQNSATMTQTITVIDELAPVFSDTPQDMTVDCLAEDALIITATDNCDDNVNVIFEEEQIGTCPYQIIRTWTAVDRCQNSATMTQTITVIDELVPVFSNMPADITVNCTTSQIIPITATDNCDKEVEVQFTEEKIGTCPYQLIRTWTAMDACQNVAKFTQNITVIDEMPPVFSETPQDVTVNCTSVGIPEIIATDNCDDEVEVIFEERTVTTCPYQIIRTWTAVDRCQNTATMTQTITVIDELAPVFSETPQDVTVACATTSSPKITATDNCEGEVEVIFEERTTSSCPYQIIRTWTAVDMCQNRASMTQFITIVDDQAPVFSEIPRDTTLSCNAIRVPTITATDNCDDRVEVIFEEQATASCPYQLIRIWTAVDKCQNVATMTQSITIVDDQAPIFREIPRDTTVACNAIRVPIITATDNCDGEVDVIFEEQTTGSCPYQLIRTWTAADKCQNVATITQTITISDDQAPVFSDTPQDITVNCNAIQVPIITATDNCDNLVDVIFEERTEGSCPYQIIRTWTATDRCQNMAELIQTITVQDTIAPTISVPPNITVECEESLPQFEAITSTDNCGGDPVITFVDTRSSSVCSNALIIRTWTVTDRCGNTSSASQTITVNSSPAITKIKDATELNLECKDASNEAVINNWLATNGGAMINNKCSNVTWTHDYQGLAVGCQEVLVTFTAKDDCDNTVTTVGKINITDTSPPTWTTNIGALDKTYPCGSIIPNPTPPTAIDNCRVVRVDMRSDITNDGACIGESIRLITWVATDECGNLSTTYTTTIKIIDEVPPTLSGIPNDITIDCDVIPDPPTVVAIDNCDKENLPVQLTETKSGSKCQGQIILRTWTAIDDCGNQVSETQSITLGDKSPPSIECPDDITITVDGDCSTLGNTTIELPKILDACGTPVEVVSSVDLSQGLPLGTTTVNLTATDACGNKTNCTVNVIVKNNSLTLQTNEDIIVDCDMSHCGAIITWDDPEGLSCCTDCNETSTPTCYDIVQIRGPEKGSIFPVGTSTITYQLTDACGNEAQSSFAVTVKACVLPDACSASALFSDRYWIERMELANLNNTSGSNGGYKDFTNLLANLTKGNTYSMAVVSSATPYYGKVWIDYNQNGDFQDDGEEVAYFNNNEPSISFTIPNNTNTGLMRMRVIVGKFSNPAVCGKIKYGEVEDYSIKIIGNGLFVPNTAGRSLLNTTPTTNKKETPSVVVYPNPVKDILTVEVQAVQSPAAMLKIHNNKGQLVYQQRLEEVNQAYLIDVSKYTKGIYIISIVAKDKTSVVEKFTKF